MPTPLGHFVFTGSAGQAFRVFPDPLHDLFDRPVELGVAPENGCSKPHFGALLRTGGCLAQVPTKQFGSVGHVLQVVVP
jgi:hypothetical protein